MTRHTKKWKASKLQELQLLAGEYPVIAIASLSGFPSALSQQLRKKLQGKAVVKVSKTRVVKKALLGAKSDLKALEPHLSGSVAVIFTTMNPFELFSFLKKNRGSVAAKEGSVAPQDIVIPAGDTGIPPGPALSDLKAAGLKTVIKGPTISIAEDKVVAKTGDVITKGVAGALSKLNIKPIKVGLNIVACLEKGELFPAGVLDFDAEGTMQRFVQAHRNAVNLAVEIEHFTKETTEILVMKAFRNAKALSEEAKLGAGAPEGAAGGKAAA